MPIKEFPNFRQLDAMDCGPAALKIISKFYGRQFTMKFLRDLCNTTKEGVSMLDISRAADSIGIRSLALKASFHDLREKIPLPAIIHWNHSHFVVIYKITSSKVYVSDPQLGLTHYSLAEFEKYWKGRNSLGYVLVLEPGADFGKADKIDDTIRFNKFYKYLRPHLRLLVNVFLGMLMGIILSLVFPLITQSIVDIGIETQDLDFIRVLLIATIILTISSAISQFLQNKMMLYISDRTNITMVSDFITKLVNLPIVFFDRKMTSDILNRIADYGRIQKFIFESLLSMVIAALSFIVYSIILVHYDAGIFWIFTLGSILYVLWVIVFLRRRRKLDLEYFDAAVTNQNDIIELVTGIEEVKTNNLQQSRKWNWQFNRLAIMSLNIKMLNLSELQNLGNILDKVKNTLITFVSANAVISGDMTLGMMLSTQYIIGQMNAPIAKLIGFIQSYQDAKISIERVSEIINEEQEESHFQNNKPLPIPEFSSIIFEKVSFSYHSNLPAVLQDVSFEIPQGKMTAIVGESGSGKSTIIKLLLLLYTNYSGKISVSGMDLKMLDIHQWRQICGTVLQNGQIFPDTILANIVLDTDNVDVNRLNDVLELTNLTSFIDKQPLKLYTFLNSGGDGISGGQAQRILLARAIYKDPRILVLDEATNSLDAKNESEITKRLIEKFRGRTTLVIAHRLSTILTADQIIVFHDGRIVENGTHDHLMQNGSYYTRLIESQLN